MNAEISLPSLSPAVESFLEKISKKTYFLRILRSGIDRRISVEATTIVKSGLFTEEEIESAYLNREELNQVSTPERRYFSALYQIKNAFTRMNERNLVKYGSETLNSLLNEILVACSEKFEISWTKERERISTLYNNFLAFVSDNGVELSSLSNSEILNSFFGKYCSSLKMKTSDLNYFDTLRRIRNINSQGLDVVLGEEKSAYVYFLTKNLTVALSKYIPKNTERIENVQIRNSVKGYAIDFDACRNGNPGDQSSDLFIAHISTRSIPVCGPIVSFHYRYITNVSNK